VLKAARRVAGHVRRWLFPKPEVAAWHHACANAERVPRYTPAQVRLMGYHLDYVDALTLAPQWDEIFVRHVYRFTTSERAPRILDCGANVGLASLYFKRLYPAARLTAYEADPRICAALRANLTRNGAADTNVVEAAVWTEPGTLEFRCEGADSGSVVQAGPPGHGELRRVTSVRLRDVLLEGPIDLLKLDVEGAEHDVLPDCRDALRNVRAMIVEVHELEPGRRRAPALLRLLDEAGYCYAADELVPMPWIAEEREHFGAASAWAFLVRAWRP
jgi:FkbM family methyltransferase